MQQHRQHFNLSEEAKLKLEELTARRYPGKQRRQSQLVEDLIAEAFAEASAKERGMSMVTTGMQEPEADQLAAATQEALGLAQMEAQRSRATEVEPEHLLLGLIEQGNSGVLRAINSMKLDFSTIRHRLSTTESLWNIAEERYKDGESIKAKVIDYNKGGLIVDVSGIRGFVPITQILSITREEFASGGENPETTAKLRSMPGKELQLKIIEINRARNRLILSERLAAQEWRQRRLGLSLHQGDEPNPVPQAPSLVETGRMNIMGEKAPVSLEAASAGSEEAPSASVVESGENLPFSSESQRCIDRAVSIAERMHSPLVQPDHLFWGVLLNRHIRGALAPLPSDPTIIVDFTEGEQTRRYLCPSCWRPVQPQWKHCAYCGASLVRTCPSCGSPCPDIKDAQFCFECGSSLE
jgi:hypothetical protein